jgi:hypothetical protein
VGVLASTGNSAGSPPALTGSVSQATVTTTIEDGQPVDFETEIPNSVGTVYFYALLNDLQGQTVKLRWKYQGKPMQEVPLRVDTTRYTAVSDMKMQPEWTGEWTVEVLDGSGKVLSTTLFNYLAPL